MNIRIRRLLAVLLAAVMLLPVAACRKKGTDGPTASPNANVPQPDMFYISIDARNAYVHPSLPAELRSALTGEGLLIRSASVNMQKDQTVLNVFTVVANLYGLDFKTDPETGAVLSVQGVENGTLGEDSYWMILVNGEPVDYTLDQLTVNKDDQITLVYTCNGGQDVGDPGSTAYEELTPDPNATPEPTPEPTPTPDPNATPEPGSKTSGRH